MNIKISNKELEIEIKEAIYLYIRKNLKKDIEEETREHIKKQIKDTLKDTEFRSLVVEGIVTYLEKYQIRGMINMFIQESYKSQPELPKTK